MEAGQTFSGRGNGVSGSGGGGFEEKKMKYRTAQQRAEELRWEKEQEAKAKAEAQREAFNRKHDQQNSRRQESTARDRESTRNYSSSAGGSYGGGTSTFNASGLNETNAILRSILATLRKERGVSGEGGVGEGGQPSGAPSTGAARNTGQNIFTSVLRASLFKDLVGLIGRMPSAQSGLDLVSPSLSMIGAGAGAGVGRVIDLIPGVDGTSTTLANLGAQGGAFYGGAITREIQTKTALAKASAQYRAISGTNYTNPNLAIFGMDNIAGATLAGGMAKSGTGAVDTNDLINTVALKKIADLDDGIIMSIEKQSRVSGRGFAMRASNAIGIARSQGIRAGLYGDVLAQQSSIAESHIMTGGGVNLNDINATMFGLNRIGGAFAIGSPTALPNQHALEQAIQTPSTPFGQATMYQILRKMNPNADFADLQALQEQAGSNPEILRQFLKATAITGGSSPMIDKLMFQGATKQFGMTATSANQLYAGFMSGDLDSMSNEQLSKFMSSSELRAKASDLTPQLEKDMASVTNAFTISFTKGIDTIAEQWKTQMMVANEKIIAQWSSWLPDGKAPNGQSYATGLKEEEGLSELIQRGLGLGPEPRSKKK